MKSQIKIWKAKGDIDMSIKIYTDASFKGDGLSTHHYRINVNNKRKNRRTFSGYETTSVKSEVESITRALQKVFKKGWSAATIYTDCLPIVQKVNSDCSLLEDHDYNYIKHLLKSTRSRLVWVSRKDKGIKEADKECRKLMETRLRREVDSY